MRTRRSTRSPRTFRRLCRARLLPGLPYSPWQLLEHLRITQQDILEFCRNPKYVEKHWPDDYWPATPGPPKPGSWANSIKEFRQDQKALQRLASDPSVDLLAKIPHGTGQTYLRELLLVADHNAYHLGQMVAVRRLLGDWPSKSGNPGLSALLTRLPSDSFIGSSRCCTTSPNCTPESGCVPARGRGRPPAARGRPADCRHHGLDSSPVRAGSCVSLDR